MFEQETGTWLTSPNSLIYWDAHFLTESYANHLFQRLTDTLPWQQESITMFGKEVLQPRLQAWHGHASYTYSGLTMHPHPWTKELRSLEKRCAKLSGQRFNSVLANMYRDGRDSMGWHQDNEPELGPNPIIASLSLGGPRRFVLKHKYSNEKQEFILGHGALLIMAGETQHYWLHAIPKTKKVVNTRINLTFRHVIER
ncbi:alpha-ketoglutarate-dependent dioxygenase AlkB [Vibrio sp. S9_S30]|uniref:alpha-ketoglutarate-dependent dioxygenase AlkB family protein n=1 Tax=Vibrio sp. S9_S30 TaxID=2720226 RepID=UPI001680847B|nr:alpha-ketoglutarate-dependent dioxygenase AlkB [Vibrio sp. S9_S30]MBD1557088.1 alpha-ketoglutarate-dependent dioxygenase AlkB [Vibrio sp. S9_S30]